MSPIIPITKNSSQWTAADTVLLDAVMDADLPAAREAFRKGARPMAYHAHVDGLGEGPFWSLLAGTLPALHDEAFLINVPMLQLFIQKGANLNHHHEDQDATPLMAVCESGAVNAVEALEVLLAAGAVPRPSLILDGVRFPSETIVVEPFSDLLLPPELPPLWEVIWGHMSPEDCCEVLNSGPFFGLGSDRLNDNQHRRAQWLLDHGARLDRIFMHEGVDCRASSHLHSESLARLRAHIPAQPTPGAVPVGTPRRRLSP